MSDSCQKNRVFSLLADRNTRAHVHGIILLAGAAVFLAVVLVWHDWSDAPKSPDKALHFFSGQVIAAISFYMAYLCIVARVLFISKSKDSLTVVLFWLPTMIAGAVVAALLIVTGLAIGKEALDLLGLGAVEWMDFEVSIDGAISMAYPIAFIMAFTPLFIPLDMIMQMPKLFFTDMRSGIKIFDNYTHEHKSHKMMNKPAEVLVVEDDIICATTVMNFCSKVNLKCHHVSTASDADDYLRKNRQSLRLIILDNFLRVDENGSNMTGCEWLLKITGEYLLEKRKILVVIISGYTDRLGPAASHADLVLQKPWDPFRLTEFLKRKRITRKKWGQS